MDSFILVIGHARIAYEGKCESRAVYGERQTENKLEISQNQENERTKTVKTILMDGNNLKLLIFRRSKDQ